MSLHPPGPPDRRIILILSDTSHTEEHRSTTVAKHIAEAVPADYHPLFNQNSQFTDSSAQFSLMGKGSTATVCSHDAIGSFSADVLAFVLRRIMFCSPCSTDLPCFCATSISMALDSAVRPSTHPKDERQLASPSKYGGRMAKSTPCVGY